LEIISEDSTFRISLDTLLKSNPDNEEFQQARTGLINNYDRLNRTQNENLFNNFLVVAADKEILVSTYPLWEGKILDQDVYREMLSSPTSIGLFNISPFYTEEHTDQFQVSLPKCIHHSLRSEKILLTITNRNRNNFFLENFVYIHQYLNI